MNNSFTDNSVAFYSSKIAGMFSVHASASIDDAATDDHDVGIGAEFSNKMFKAGVSNLSLGDTPIVAANGGATDALRVYGSAKLSGATVGASFESIDFGGTTTTNATFLHVNGSFNVNSALKVAASFGSVTDGAASGRNGTGTGFTVGAFYKVLPKTTFSAMFTSTDFDDAAVADPSGLALGVVQSF